MLKGSLIGAILGLALFLPAVYRAGPLDEFQRWLLKFGLAQGLCFGIPFGMSLGVLVMEAWVRRERRLSARLVEGELPEPQLPSVPVLHPTRRPWLLSMGGVLGLAALAIAGLRVGGGVLCGPLLLVDILVGLYVLRASLGPFPRQIQFDEFGLHVTRSDGRIEHFAWDTVDWPPADNGRQQNPSADVLAWTNAHLWGREARWLQNQMLLKHLGDRLECEGENRLLNGAPVSARGVAGRSVVFLSDGMQTRGRQAKVIPYNSIERVLYEHDGYAPRAFTLTTGKQRIRLLGQTRVRRLLRERASHAVWEEVDIPLWL